VSQPYSDRVGRSFLSGYFLCPALMTVIAVIAGAPPAGQWPDWEGDSIPARLINFLFLAHLIYAVGLVALLRGWRLVALGRGILSLPTVGFVYLCAYWHVTGVYL
jgi:hypothetical protein